MSNKKKDHHLKQIETMANTRVRNDKCYVAEHIERTQKEADYLMYPGQYYRGNQNGSPYFAGADCSNGYCGGLDRERVHLDSLLTRGAGKTVSRCGSGDVNPLPPDLRNPGPSKKDAEIQKCARQDMTPLETKFKKGDGPYDNLMERDVSGSAMMPTGYYGDYQGVDPLGNDKEGNSFTQADTRDLARQEFCKKGASGSCKSSSQGKNASGANPFSSGNSGIAPLYY